MQPKVSIIIPVYNVERYLRQCLDSVVNQTLREIQIICVNDGSPDRSLAILQEYADRDPRITVVDQPNAGVSAARNTALSCVQGEYVLFVDSDDTLDPELCETVMQKAVSTEADITFFFFRRFGSNQTSSIFRFLTLEDKITPEQKISVARYGFPYLKFYRTGFLSEHEIRFPVGLRYEDIFFHWKSLLLANKVSIVPKPFYNYRERPGSMLSSRGVEYCDIVIIFDLVKQFLIQYGFYEIWQDEFLRFKLTMYEDCYQGIQRRFKPELLTRIKASLGEEEQRYCRTASRLRGKVRDFYAGLKGGRIAWIRYQLRSIAYKIERWIMKSIRNCVRQDASGKMI